MNAPVPLLHSPTALPRQQTMAGASQHHSIPHNAKDFLRQVAQLQKRSQYVNAVSLFSEEGNVHFHYLARRFLFKQEEFRCQYKPTSVEIAFHYTRAESLDSIRKQGLLQSTGKPRHGDRFGSGVYVANNPHAFMSYGRMGLVCLIIKGGIKQMYSKHDDVDSSVDTLQGNKLANQKSTTSPYFDEIILRSSSQVLPLLVYSRELVNNAELLWELQASLQHLVDRVLNHGKVTFLKRILPDYQDIRFEHDLKAVRGGWLLFNSNPNPSTIFNQPQGVSIPKKTTPKKTTTILDVSYCIPSALSFGTSEPTQSYCYALLSPPDKDCPICLVSLKEHKALTIDKCQHHFHESCLERALAASNKCPICRCVLGEPTGSCPFGTLITRKQTDMHCRGFETVATLCLEYDIPSGTQTASHDNPGRAFTGTKRTAYLPDTKEGRELSKRLQYAFSRGLTFIVGTSITSGKSDVVCWASIHHKTALSGGQHGFPDPAYFINCNEDLDALHVPKACDL